MNYKYILFFWLLAASPYLALSQTNEEWEKNQGQMEKLIYDVVGSKEIKLNQANRIFDPVPPPPVQELNRNLDYNFEDIYYAASGIGIKLRPRRLASTPQDFLYGNYLKLGFGNFITPLVEAYVANKRQKEYSFGANFKLRNSLRGPVDDRNSGAGIWGVNIFGDVYADKVTIYSDLSFNRSELHFYGYPEGTQVDAQNIRQHYNRVQFKTGVRNTSAEDDFQYDFYLGLNNQSDDFDEKETAFITGINTSLEVIDNIFVDTDAEFQYIARNTGFEEIDRAYFTGKVGGRFSKGDLNIFGGIRIDYNPDSLSNSGINLFPLINARYALNDQIVLFGKLDGGVNLNTWMSSTIENPYVLPGQHINSTVDKSRIEVGLEGRLRDFLTYQTGLQFAEVINMQLYSNNGLDISRFDILYDEGISLRTNIYAQSKLDINQKYRAGFRVDYFNYNMSELEAAFFQPQWKLTFDAAANIVEKIDLGLTLDTYTGLSYIENDDVKELPAILDLGLNANYHFSNKFSAFFQLENILNNNYQFYYRYPVRGFTGIGGVIYKF